MLDVKQLLAECEERMEMSVMHLDETLSHIRAGKANVHILDQVMVNSYGSMVPVNNVAAITTPDSRTIAIKPWDKSMFAPIEKAIIDSNVGIMPENNGEIIRLGIPPLTEERRRDLTKATEKVRILKALSATCVAMVSTNSRRAPKMVCPRMWLKMLKTISRSSTTR